MCAENLRDLWVRKAQKIDLGEPMIMPQRLQCSTAECHPLEMEEDLNEHCTPNEPFSGILNVQPFKCLQGKPRHRLHLGLIL